MENYLTTKDVMERYSVTKQTVNNWIKKGLLVPFKTPGRNLFSVQAIRDFERKVSGL